MPQGGNNLVRSPAIEQQVIDLMSEGVILSEIARTIGVTMATIQRWRLNDPAFDVECSRAQELGFEAQADSLHTIPDTYEDVQRGKLKSDNIRWVLSRRAAHKYGDRIAVDAKVETFDLNNVLREAKSRVLHPSFIAQLPTQQVIDLPQLPRTASTDTLSVDTPENGDAIDKAWEDILS